MGMRREVTFFSSCFVTSSWYLGNCKTYNVHMYMHIHQKSFSTIFTYMQIKKMYSIARDPMRTAIEENGRGEGRERYRKENN